MAAYIRFDGVDGETAHSGENLEMIIKVLDAGTFYGGMTDVDVTVRVVDTATSSGHAVTEYESGLIYSGESGGMAGDSAGPFFAFDASFRGGVDTPAAHGTGGGGGAGKVSLNDVSLSTSVPKAAAGEYGGEAGVEDFASADADTSALGNTYQGVTTIAQGVLQVEHATMMLSFQYDLA
jgi:hypothetical protein